MAFVIVEACIDVKDGECTAVCPVDCIYEGGRMYYIQPDECVQCGLCESVCPVDAIRNEYHLDPDNTFKRVNREFFSDQVTGWGTPGGWEARFSTDQDHPLVAGFPERVR